MDLAQVLAEAGPTLLLAMVLVSLAAGKLIFPRELEVCQKRVTELQAEADEWKHMALESQHLTARAVEVVREKS